MVKKRSELFLVLSVILLWNLIMAPHESQVVFSHADF